MRGKCFGFTMFALWLATAQALSQGLLVDQASGTISEPVTTSTILPTSQIAQSFTPSLSAVGFVQFSDYISANDSSVVLVINLRQGAYNGPIVSSTDPVFLVNKITQIGIFYFPENVLVTPNQLYFFEPMVQSAGTMFIGTKSPSSYVGGDLWSNGLMDPQADVWFREGVVVPEPGSVCLLLVGFGGLLCHCRLGRRS